VFIVLCGNRYQHMHVLAVVPLNAVGKLQHAHASMFYMLAAFGRAVRYCYGVA
jgi:hypothetical protein